MEDFIKSLNLDLIDWRYILWPLVYILVGIFAYRIFGMAFKVFLHIHPERLSEEQFNRLETFRSLGMNLSKYVIALVVILATMAIYGVDVGSIFAGLGIATAVFGLALQDFAKDIISGLSILSELQYKVGDVIEVDGFRGRVIFLGLKTTKIRNYRGKVKIVANRNMSTVINYSNEDSLAQVNLQVGYRSKTEQVEKALEAVKRRLDGTMEQMTGEITISGIIDMDNNGVTWRLVCPCQPYKHFAVQRAIRREAKAEFERAGIEMPYNQVTIHKADK